MTFIMNEKRLIEILDGFNGRRVLVVGDAFIDRYVFGEVRRLNPEAPVPILAAQTTEEMTGGAGNVAKNLATLGAQVVLVAAVGADEGARRLEQQAKVEGYETRLLEDDSRSTIEKVRYLVRNQQLFRVDYEETHDLSSDGEESLMEIIVDSFKEGVEAILVSDYAKGVVTEQVAAFLMQQAKEHGVLMAVDAKPSRMPFFKGASFISPNRKEAHEMLGINEQERGGREADQLAKALHERFETDVFLTLSADGVYVLTQDGVSQHVPQEHKVEVFDPSGAGDTAVAALTLAKLAGATPEEMATVANAAGAAVVQKVGSVGVIQDEISHMILHTHE